MSCFGLLVLFDIFKIIIIRVGCNGVCLISLLENLLILETQGDQCIETQNRIQLRWL